jgi:diadenosine tetraphosphate (Ap4A) HIT family hydrolase
VSDVRDPRSPGGRDLRRPRGRRHPGAAAALRPPLGTRRRVAAHVVTYTGVTPALWARINADALHAAKMLERIRQPLRVYVTSTGSSAGELTQTSMHLHVHVIPLYDDHDRPADVFSWQGGVWVGEPDEWHALRDEYAAAWRAAVTAQA